MNGEHRNLHVLTHSFPTRRSSALGEFGNPDLKPYEAWNFDAGVAYYLPNNGALSAGLFYKDVKNFLVDTHREDPGEYLGIAYDEATVPNNSNSAMIRGRELTQTQALRVLPTPPDGVTVQDHQTSPTATADAPHPATH